ncbi:MAG TPA: nucleotidyl transferase AbiEii/AbiGii toxin family protein, partial [Actinoplanes sp.]|nr:nucleotidyl transferase AbiEii/AbiGii toxin family protein [Actinoplanes sp.]
GAIADVERQLRLAAALDIGDWMRFEVGPAARIRAAGAQAAQVRVTAAIGTKVWAAFQVDIVADGVEMSAEPDPVPPLTSLFMSEKRLWRAYPLVDHVADKVCAILERHDGRPSTRFKDLVDLVAIAERATVSAALQIRALGKEGRRRGLELPAGFDVPDRSLWVPGYRAEARRAAELSARELDDALAVARVFLDPLLAGTAAGAWDFERQAWVGPSAG